MLFSREMIFDRMNNVVNIALPHFMQRNARGRARGFSFRVLRNNVGFLVRSLAPLMGWASLGFSCHTGH